MYHLLGIDCQARRETGQRLRLACIRMIGFRPQTRGWRWTGLVALSEEEDSTWDGFATLIRFSPATRQRLEQSHWLRMADEG